MDTLDNLVVAGFKARKLGGVRIKMVLAGPKEQMWYADVHNNIVNFEVASKWVDKNGVTSGQNTPKYRDRLPPNKDIVAIIHTHPSSWATGVANDGDRMQAQDHDVYGIHHYGVWVLRKGAVSVKSAIILCGRKPSTAGIFKGGVQC